MLELFWQLHIMGALSWHREGLLVTGHGFMGLPKNNPAVQAAGTNLFRCNSTNRQNQPSHQNYRNF